MTWTEFTEMVIKKADADANEHIEALKDNYMRYWRSIGYPDDEIRQKLERSAYLDVAHIFEVSPETRAQFHEMLQRKFVGLCKNPEMYFAARRPFAHCVATWFGLDLQSFLRMVEA